MVCYASSNTVVLRHCSKKLSVPNTSLNNILYNEASLDFVQFPSQFLHEWECSPSEHI